MSQSPVMLKTKGLVVRASDVGESDRLLTMLTPERGRLSALSKGSRSPKNKNMPSSQLFSYADYVLYEKNGYFWVRESDLAESFFAIRTDIEKLALASYICDVAGDMTQEEQPEPELLRLTLNCLYLLSRKESSKPNELIKAVFELRACAECGYAPELSGCTLCGGSTGETMYLDIPGGELICAKCRGSLPPADENTPDTERYLRLSGGAAAAAAYITSCSMEKLFGFRLPAVDTALLGVAAEKYLLCRAERGFASLEFYKSLKI